MKLSPFEVTSSSSLGTVVAESMLMTISYPHQQNDRFPAMTEYTRSVPQVNNQMRNINAGATVPMEKKSGRRKAVDNTTSMR